ncbi:MAG: hypothetical protein COY09_01680 [Candidatus Portnoybacteria bacterium CG_4_10_14_0_2_um_filter_39_11]|uniref:Uncharacterized protein n=1 Tax=Candidatus Portnoybacteria bacterium CG_4_10_14_0_2_um_filter_39_11 TaxID=1974797 RepID=A0A2M7UIF3_9BACT|nr:MAG: hypothetical protein AUJ33_02760 [Parcubacteria group bacterium CG1_02_40_25]PIZ70992.1 MAG: hypothetical protein COY09_01680 [Candidatus Portnoybacteria bacterium CG_4_10_14_0_2_um_filter_39_11]
MSRAKFIFVVSVSAVVCLFIVIGLAFFNLSKIIKKPLPDQAKINWEILAPEGVVSGPNNIIFCAGVITDIGDGLITLEAAKSRNIFFKTDRLLTVKVDSDAQILTAIEYVDASTGTKARRSLSFSELKTGDSIIIQSKDGIGIVDDITALKVYVTE